MLTVQQYAKGATIPKNHLGNAQLTVNIVNEIFNKFPNQFTFNSGYRTPAHNAAVGGVPNSYHAQALAADIAPKNGNYNQYKSALTAIVAKYGWELVDERNKNHFHIEPSKNAAALVVGNRQPLNNSQQPKAISEQFSDLSPQSQTAIIAGTFLILYLLLSD
jgi:phosphoribosylformylglycinamidine (FGAM) synthase-like enzyme